MFIFFLLSPSIWVLTILYLFNIIPYSLLYLSGFAFVFTFFYCFYLNINVSKSITIIIFEFIIYYLNYYKHIIIDKKKFISYTDMNFNICIVIFYVLFLYCFNRTPFSVYGIELKKIHEDRNESVFQYIIKKISDINKSFINIFFIN